MILFKIIRYQIYIISFFLQKVYSFIWNKSSFVKNILNSDKNLCKMTLLKLLEILQKRLKNHCESDIIICKITYIFGQNSVRCIGAMRRRLSHIRGSAPQQAAAACFGKAKTRVQGNNFPFGEIMQPCTPTGEARGAAAARKEQRRSCIRNARQGEG